MRDGAMHALRNLIFIVKNAIMKDVLTVLELKTLLNMLEMMVLATSVTISTKKDAQLVTNNSA